MLRALRDSRGRHLGIAISDSLEKAGNWDAGHLNYAFATGEDESRGTRGKKEKSCIKRNARIDGLPVFVVRRAT